MTSGESTTRARGLGVWVVFAIIGAVGLVWAIVDVVNVGASEVPGSTWLCGAMGIVVIVGSLYREFGGRSLVEISQEHREQS